MSWFVAFWQIYLYQPLVNALIYLYNTIAEQNLGVAVIYLTLGLRVLLLPLSIIAERNKLLYQQLQQKVAEAARVHRTDHIFLKQTVRALMKKYRVRPWAKTVALGIQLIVLILLYQVFVTGIQGRQLSKILYPSVEYPGRLNTILFSVPYGSATTDVYRVDIGVRGAEWAFLVAVIVFFDIAFEFKSAHHTPTAGERTYQWLFPVATFLILWALPIVKSIFILTSIAFSYLLILVRLAFFREKKPAQ